MKTSANVVGRRLRRYLGALLAAGFGVTWWSFVPPAAAAVVIRPAPAIAMAPEVVELRWSQSAMEPAPPPPIKPKPRVHRPKPDSTPIVVVDDPLLVPVLVPVLVPPLVTPTLDPIVVPDPQPEPIEFPPIRTRSSR